MQVHRLEQVWIAASFVLIVGLIATVTYGAVGVGIQMVDNSGGQVEADALDEHPGFSDPGVERTGNGEFDVYVITQQFSFQPGSGDPITVPAGSSVTFYITSRDVIHGFAIVGTNVNTMAIPGQISKITVEFEEPGEYGILCNEYCGAGHHTMEGQLVVVPPAEYDGGDGQ